MLKISKINENCKELKKLGVNASVNYSQTNSNDGAVKNIRTSNIYKSTEDYFNDFANILEKEIEKERAKLTPEERKEVEDAEKFLKTMFGF